MLEVIMLMLLKLQSIFNTTDIKNQPQNLKSQKMEGSIRSQKKNFILWAIQIPTIDSIILLSAHRHTAHTMTSLTTDNFSSTVCNIIIGSLVGRHCILLCELTLCSSLMIVFLWMQSIWILVIWIENHEQDASNREYLPCPKRNHIYCKRPFNI